MTVKDPEDYTETEDLFVKIRRAYLDLDQAWIVLGTVLQDREYGIEFTDYLRPDQEQRIREVEDALKGHIEELEEIADELEDRFGIDPSEL